MIDGPLSPRNKRVTAARRLLKRGFRTETSTFLVEGPQAVREALALAREQPGLLRQLFVTDEAAVRHPEIIDSARAANCPVDRVDISVVAELSQTVTPQGVVAVCGSIDVALMDVVGDTAAVRPTLVAVLSNVRDPGNAGTVIRAADAAGAEAVILTESSVDPYNGKCVRASAGSIFHLPLVSGAAMIEAVDALKAAGLRVVAADGAGARDLSQESASGALAAPTAWVFGNEAWGLPREILELCDAVVRVPIYGRAESLNLAAAAAVCLYASASAQRSTPH